jgi:hypothetical protein
MKVNDAIEFMKTTGCRELHLTVFEKSEQEALVALANSGDVRLSTWNNRAWREISYQECPTEAFFRNADDCNHVRLCSSW